jgi:hypothetical protein
MNLKKSLLIALVLGLVVITSWELYWRSKGYKPELEDNKELWAVQRSRVQKASEDDVILIGDSRMLYDLQLDAWEKETGIRPIQLATAGSTPLPIFHDIVHKTDFQGTILISVTPDIFFTTSSNSDMSWYRISTRIDHFYNRTYADRLNHLLDVPLQRTFTFLRNDEEDWTDDLDLKNLIQNIRLGNREGEPYPPFYRFQSIELDRNVLQYEKTSTDTVFANSIIKNWMLDITSMPDDAGKPEVFDYFNNDLQKYLSRGGRIALIRFPSSGGYRIQEEIKFPRNEFYEKLIAKSKIPSYHFEDYEALNQYYCPEWSHLSVEDANTFTTDLARILLKDQVINK